MAIKKCKGCGSIFDGITPYCSRCMQEIDYRYKNVRDYLYENPDETVDQVSEATDEQRSYNPQTENKQ